MFVSIQRCTVGPNASGKQSKWRYAMPENIVSPRTLSVHKEHEFLGKLEAAGLGDAEAQLVIGSKGNELARKLVTFIRTGGYEPSVSQKTARAIMGQNYLGVDQSIQHLKASPSKADLRTLEDVPFAENVLEACKDTHVLVAVLPMSVMGLWERTKQTKHLFYSKDDPWYKSQAFAKEKGQAGWHLVRKDIVPNSTSKTWQEQQSLLGKDDENPTARVLVYTVILTFLATGVKLLPNIYARVSDVDSDGNRVYVGYFDGSGLYVNYYWDDYRNDFIGVASARKSN